MGGLKEQVDRFGKNNAMMKAENAAIKTEVNKLSKAQEELGATADRLKETTNAYKENISKFKALDEKLGKLADDNIAGLEKLQVNLQEIETFVGFNQVTINVFREWNQTQFVEQIQSECTVNDQSIIKSIYRQMRHEI